MKRLKFGFWMIAGLLSFAAFAEVEEEGGGQRTFRTSDYSLGELFTETFREFVSSPAKKPRKRPVFKNPYEEMTEEEIKAQVTFFSNTRPLGAASKDIVATPATIPLDADNQIEIYLPENRCQTGWIKWGDAESGYHKCHVLGRGDTVLGSLKLLAGLQKKVPDYKNWILSQNAGGFTDKNTKPNSRFEGENDLSYCLARPENQTNGQTIIERPDSTVGSYNILTGRSIHRGKEEWGYIPGGNTLLIPLQMVKIPDPRNNRFSNDGRLLLRDDFWVHSHENDRDPWPLEALNTWGCPRLSRKCEHAIQKWTAGQIAKGKKVGLTVREQDARAANYDHE